VTDAVYELMGCNAPVGRKKHFVDEVFSNMGGDTDGLVTREMFLAFFNRRVVSLKQIKKSFYLRLCLGKQFRAGVWWTSTVLSPRTV
jgi:hypothetical protein